MAKYLLGVDNGSTMVKAAVFDTEGNELATAGRKVQHTFPKSDQAECDMNQLWADTAAVIKDSIAKSGVDASDIVGVSCTGHGNGMYLIDNDGKPARPAVCLSDTRGRKYIEEWTEANTLDTIIHKTTQAIWPLQPNAILRWMKDNEPEVLENTAWFFCCKDFIRFQLTGEAFIERTDMSGTSLINVVTGEYDDEVLETWGLLDLKRIMPPIKGSAEICGTVTAEASAQTGLAEGTPVAGGLFDIDACGLSCSMTDETELCMVAGTWGNNQYIAKEPVVSKDVFMTSCYSIPGYYLILEGSSTSASNLEWMVSQFFEADKELLGQRSSDKSIFALCDDLVAETTAAGSGLTFLPYLYGSPVSLDAKGVFFGLDGRHTRGDVLRAVFEGIIFGHYWHVERLLQFRDMPEHIRLTGGAARSDVWAQMFADIFQTSVEIPAGTELGALGSAIAAAVAVGVYDSYDSACTAMAKIARVYSPNAELADVYAKKYARYKKLIDILQPHWADMAWKVED